MPCRYTQDPDETKVYALDLGFWLDGRTIDDAVVADINVGTAGTPSISGKYVSVSVSDVVENTRTLLTLRVTAGATVADFTLTIDGRKR